MSDMDKAKELFSTGKYTLVMIGNGLPLTSPDPGLKPLVQLLDSGISCAGFSAVDKVVGRAAAFLYTLLEISELHATITTKDAIEILQAKDIAVTYDTLVQSINNKNGTGPCPMELAVANEREALKALKAIKGALKS